MISDLFFSEGSVQAKNFSRFFLRRSFMDPCFSRHCQFGKGVGISLDFMIVEPFATDCTVVVEADLITNST